MRKIIIISASLLASIAVLFGIFGYIFKVQKQESKLELHQDFQTYWDDGKAELTSFELEQARYGEIHKGEALLIYVYEPFSKSKQVKLDNWQNASDREDVLKLNYLKKFDTGIYSYSTMLSVFSSVENGRMVKLTNSVQEWCGQVFMQLNTTEDEIKLSSYSYFESEGDKELTLSKSFTEDELWNLIRLNPESLPTGEITLIPSTNFLRFNHHSLLQVTANISLEKEVNQKFSEEELNVYTLQYENPEERTLKIYFAQGFPYEIIAWEDTYKDIAWNSERQLLTTTAKRKKTIQLDYWNKNQLQHQELQKLLD